jgi:hypothetical protein
MTFLYIISCAVGAAILAGLLFLAIETIVKMVEDGEDE